MLFFTAQTEGARILYSWKAFIRCLSLRLCNRHCFGGAAVTVALMVLDDVKGANFTSNHTKAQSLKLRFKFLIVFGYGECVGGNGRA
ncbi:hypothetical protein RJT34_30176 [Clitoria ternatea]|uniref:Uncharacterized protein n=1 Tax=Clitoria ternatea TaxID=43366 RepID=A0AAN9I740_CLITE